MLPGGNDKYVPVTLTDPDDINRHLSATKKTVSILTSEEIDELLDTVDESTRTNDVGEVLHDNIQDVLNTRGNRYGEFCDHARISQSLQNIMFTELSSEATPYMREAISMICHKLARIANGDPFYDDSWIDISGYATLVVNELKKDSK